MFCPDPWPAWCTASYVYSLDDSQVTTSGWRKDSDDGGTDAGSLILYGLDDLAGDLYNRTAEIYDANSTSPRFYSMQFEPPSITSPGFALYYSFTGYANGEC